MAAPLHDGWGHSTDEFATIAAAERALQSRLEATELALFGMRPANPY
jgi:hypothetical protein